MAEVPDEVFAVLGVPPDADAQTVERAYRDLATEYHPDRHPGDPAAAARFERIERAYADWRSRHGAGLEDVFGQFQQLFGDFFGALSPGGTPGTRRGADRLLPMTISYVDARDGCKRTVEVTRRRACRRCEGTGAERGITYPCQLCRATGLTSQAQGAFMVSTTCSVCKGRGRYAEVPCDSCEDGLLEDVEAITLSVPAGVETGIKLRLAGKGDECVAGTPGDLYVDLTVDAIGVLVRRGDDVVLEVLVGARHRLLGGSLEVPTLDGPQRIRVPRGVGDGDTVRLPGKGHVRATASSGGDPYRDLGRGDQIVVFRLRRGRA